MSRMVGTISRGVRAPIIRSGDNLAEIVTESVINAACEEGYEIRNRDIVAMTEAIVARAQGNYATVDDIAADVKAKFGALYTAFSYGAPPHAGMAPGIDRMVMLIAEEETIRDVIAFPLNGNAQDLMMGAPGNVTEQQLREVHIKVRD